LEAVNVSDPSNPAVSSLWQVPLPQSAGTLLKTYRALVLADASKSRTAVQARKEAALTIWVPSH